MTSCVHPRRSRLPAVLLTALLGAACSGGDTCAPVSADCAPLYAPTFDNVFSRTLMPRCGVAGGACHAPEGARAGLVFADIDEAYGLLTGAATGRSLVEADEPGCSALLARVGSTDPGRVMPPGAPLSDAELCAVVQWVDMGAAR
jgi:hypothetical protein